MMKRAVSATIALALVIAVAGAGCTPPAPEPVTDPLPQRANTIACIQIDDILTDPDLIEAYDQAEKDPGMPQTVDEALAQVTAETGIDPRDFTEMVLFADSEVEDYVAFILEGQFDQGALLDAIEQESGEELIPGQYQGYQIYTDSTGESALCFLSSTMVIAGTYEAVRDGIDVAVGYAAPISGPVADTYTAFGDVWVKVAAEIPPQAIDEVSGDDIPIDEETMESVEAVGASLNKVGPDVTIEVKVCFTSSALANTFAALLLTAKTFIPLSEDFPPEAGPLLERVEISSGGRCALASLTATVDEIEALVEALQEEEQ